jgi:hypothetical protein
VLPKRRALEESDQVLCINELAQPVPINLRQNPRAFYLNGDRAIRMDSAA